MWRCPWEGARPRKRRCTLLFKSLATCVRHAHLKARLSRAGLLWGCVHRDTRYVISGKQPLGIPLSHLPYGISVAMRLHSVALHRVAMRVKCLARSRCSVSGHFSFPPSHTHTY